MSPYIEQAVARCALPIEVVFTKGYWSVYYAQSCQEAMALYMKSTDGLVPNLMSRYLTRNYEKKLATQSYLYLVKELQAVNELGEM